MKIPELPADERQRINALHSLRILDTGFEERFDRLTRLASNIFQVPYAVINLVDNDRQWFKSCFGLEMRETGRDVSFCSYTILQETPLIIEDTLLDDRFCDNPYVTGAPNFRFYAGYPLATPEGYKVGTLCLLDDKPRKLDQTLLNTFQDLALIVQNELNNLELNYTLREKNVAERAWLESEARYRTLVEVMREGIIVQDDAGQIVTFNAEGGKIFNLTGPYNKGQRFLAASSKIIYEDGKPFPLELQPAMVALQTGQPVSNVVLGIHSEENILQWLLVNSQPMFNPGGKYPYQVVSSFTDITFRKEVEDRFKALSYAAFEGICIMTNGMIIEVNQALAEILGYELVELIGKDPYSLLVPGMHEQVRQNSMKEYQLPYEVIGLKKDGSQIALEIRGANLIYKNQAARVAVVRDITERKELERVQSEFISMVSHELRTPLTSIRGSLGLVVGGVAGEIAPQVKAMIEIAYKNSERLVRLINDILDIEKIESGKMVFNIMPVELGPIINQAIDANRSYAEQMGVKIKLEKAVTELKVMADSDRLIQVLTNLLSNSAKFSPSGENVSILVEALRDTVRVNVIDRGPGIPDDFKDRIFQKFAQADSSDQRLKGGTGLGLSITKTIVEAQGGHIGFNTTPGGGTTFYFELPKWVVHQPIITDSGPMSKEPRILICEDDPDIATVMRNLFEINGFITDIVFDAAQAKEILSRYRYDVMTLDLRLDGISLLRELRQQPATQNLPVVIVSANTENMWQVAAEDDLKVVDLLEKPLDQVHLLSAINRAVVLSRQNSTLPRVLYVEDNRNLVQVMSMMLDGEATVFESTTLAEAKDKLTNDKFDLILLDINLPDGSGLDLIPFLKQTTNPEVPIVIYTAQRVNPVISREVAGALIKFRATNQEIINKVKSVVGARKNEYALRN